MLMEGALYSMIKRGAPLVLKTTLSQRRFLPLAVSSISFPIRAAG